ncbi:MAG TPA: hypothetical protein VIY48_09295 [Candidatus Paceibacterota bacterium]
MSVGSLLGRMARGTKLSYLEINALTEAMENIENTIALVSRFIKPGTNIFTVDALETSGGYVHIDADGITIRADESASAFTNSYKFKAFDGGYIGQWAMFSVSTGVPYVESDFYASSIFNGANYGSAFNNFWAIGSAGANHEATIQLVTYIDGNITKRPIFKVTQNGIGDGSVVVQNAFLTMWDFAWSGTNNNPDTPFDNAQLNMYVKNDKFIIQYNDAGTVKYWYLTLNGVSGTWTFTTTAPS